MAAGCAATQSCAGHELADRRGGAVAALLQAAHAWRRQQDASRAASRSAQAWDPPIACSADTRKRSRPSGEGGEGAQRPISVPSGARAGATSAGPAECAASALDSCPCSPGGEEVVEELLLPNGVTVWSQSLSEAMHIYDEVWSRSSYLPRGSGLALPVRHPAAAPPHVPDGARCDAPLVVDVGANIGLFSLWVCGRTPGARVIAVEPAPPNSSLLVRNIERAGLSSRVEVVRAALGAAGGRGVLHYYPRMPGNSTLLPCIKWRDRVAFRPDRWASMFARREYACEVATLSCVLRRHARVAQEVDLLKVDAEGSEVDVLRGVSEADWPRIRQVAVEVHGDYMRQSVTELLASRYAHVCFHPDDELRACGLERGVVTARTRVGRRASGTYTEALAEHKLGECTVTT